MIKRAEISTGHPTNLLGDVQRLAVRKMKACAWASNQGALRWANSSPGTLNLTGLKDGHPFPTPPTFISF